MIIIKIKIHAVNFVSLNINFIWNVLKTFFFIANVINELNNPTIFHNKSLETTNELLINPPSFPPKISSSLSFKTLITSFSTPSVSSILPLSEIDLSKNNKKNLLTSLESDEIIIEEKQVKFYNNIKN